MKYAIAIMLSVLVIVFSPASHAATEETFEKPTPVLENPIEKPSVETCAQAEDNWKCLQKLSEQHEEDPVLYAMLKQCLNSPSSEYRLVCAERALRTK